MAERLSARVTGLVQGVGFRFFAVHHARRLALTGFVRNLPDGSVEVVAEGGREALLQLKRLLQRGPAGSGVREAEERWGEATGEYGSFEIKR